uniref:diverse immunoglobulin domain-containing protein 1.17 precursor n=1 Tax=Danio rerio TaxID=7955 RepID=UPI0002534BC7|nr:diverse immunoglobulin domain-containing protein 1.17 precursor [Danio rerio]AFC88161.1 diverse immunoglobulin domain-containing protein 1.17 transcript variant 1 [Danio rerio]|eukprot:NP_001245165.1 diverse immunoglobulin domain-containing protein 1.17 precursor [Danio rerio]
MADRSPLFLLLIFWTLSTGVFGAGETPVLSMFGETVHLPCENTVQDCRPAGTTWLYRRALNSRMVQLIGVGRNSEKHERLNLGSDCSLIISRVTTEDAGFYICRQWTEDWKHGHDARLFLHVLNANTAPAVTQGLFTTPTNTPRTSKSAKGNRVTAVSPDHNTNSEDPQSPNPAGSSTAVSVIVAVVAVFALLFSAPIVWLIHNRLADGKDEDCDSSLLTSVVFSETPAEHMWKRMKYSV